MTDSDGPICPQCSFRLITVTPLYHECTVCGHAWEPDWDKPAAEPANLSPERLNGTVRAAGATGD